MLWGCILRNVRRLRRDCKYKIIRPSSICVAIHINHHIYALCKIIYKYLKEGLNETSKKGLSTETMSTRQNASNKLKRLHYKLNQLNNF